uniref:Uncharacterized protein n=1 Tax=Brassica campestris TaxID=3711 RepID=M4DCF9_BRACM
MGGRNWDPGNRGGDIFIRRGDPIGSGKRGFGKGLYHLESLFWSYLWGIRATISRWKDLLDWISNGKSVLVRLGDIFRSWIFRVWKLLEGLWELIKISLFSDWLRALREEIGQISQIFLSLIGLILWLGNEELQSCYKRKGGLEVPIIHSTFLLLTFSLNFGDSGDFGLRLEMSQSQLIGKSGVVGSGENTRKRYQFYRTNQRGEEGGFRYRSSRPDRFRGNNGEEKPSLQRELRRGIIPRVGDTGEVPEEGEIPRQEERQSRGQGQEKPRESVVDSTIILASVQKVTLEPQIVENGLDVINDLLEEGNNETVGDNMVLDENLSNVLETVEASDDGFLNLTDGEVEVSNEQVQEEFPEVKEDAEINEATEGKEQPPGEVEKKKVVRKGLFKQTAVAGASSKARNIQAIISTRKRATNNTKPATRQGEGAKHHEEKGPLYPTATSSKS